MDKAMKYIRTIVDEFEEGKIYEGKVVSIKEFGAFVEFAPGKEGMVHISKISNERINACWSILYPCFIISLIFSILGTETLNPLSK